jgi:ornithine decarboxylase
MVSIFFSIFFGLVMCSFHVGSGCYATIAYVEAIKLARRVFDEAEKRGFNLSLLDLGGV